jgi:hypothetical protein
MVERLVARALSRAAGEPAPAVTNLLGDLGPVRSRTGTSSPGV